MSKKQQSKTANAYAGSEDGVLLKLEQFLEKKSKFFFRLICVLTVLFSILMFNLRISEGGDDSTYIFAGHNYAKNFTGYYYSFNAPFYAMFISVFIKFFGINLYVLKFLSLLFNFFHVYFLYKTLKGRVPNVVTIPVSLFAAINAHLLYFASQTYNEAMFLCLQSLFFYFLFKLVDKINAGENSVKANWKNWLITGFLIFLLSFTKNLGIVTVVAVICYFAINKQWIQMVWSAAAFAVVKIPFEIIKAMVWGSKSQYGAQGNILMQKDPYDASKGMEDVSGFVTRFSENINLYLSKRLFQILGFMSEESTNAPRAVAVIVILLLLTGFIIAIVKKNKLIIFSGFYLLILIGVSFVVLQTRWDQVRIILIFVPLMLLVFFYGLFEISRSISALRSIYLGLIVVVICSSFLSTLTRVKQNIPSLSKNLKGDKYAGYTTDWINYLAMSEWCSDNLPENAYVAARKAPMSFIYGNGKEFYPVYRVNSTDPDTLLAQFKKDKVTHLLLASLRMNPKKADGNVINTLHRMLQPIEQKYPGKVRLVQSIGTIEPAYLYEIKQD